MKRPLLLILAVSTLLLGTSSGDVLKPSPRPTAKPSEHSQLSQSQAREQPTPVGTPDFSYTPNRGDTAGKEQNQSNDTATKVIGASAIVSAIATVLIAWFNWQLVGVTDDMKKATADAAKASADSARAAEESANAAKIALQIDRPYVTVDLVELNHFWPASQHPKKPVTASFTF